jgi:hypothetical protein
LKGLRKGCLLAGSAVLFPLTACFISKPAPPPPPPPPAIAAQIANARTVFVSNRGEDGVAAANLPGGADACYNTFYASLQQWGHYQLVNSPKDADLILEISATKRAEIDKEILSPGPRSDTYDVTRYPAIITIAAKQTGTGSTFWTTQVEFLSTANTQKTNLRQFNEAIETLTNRLKAMVAAPNPMAKSASAP